jgi:hypothetical protein
VEEFEVAIGESWGAEGTGELSLRGLNPHLNLPVEDIQRRIVLD